MAEASAQAPPMIVRVGSNPTTDRSRTRGEIRAPDLTGELEELIEQWPISSSLPAVSGAPVSILWLHCSRISCHLIR